MKMSLNAIFQYFSSLLPQVAALAEIALRGASELVRTTYVDVIVHAHWQNLAASVSRTPTQPTYHTHSVLITVRAYVHTYVEYTFLLFIHTYVCMYMNA